MKITKEILDSGKKIIYIEWSRQERKLSNQATYLKNSFYLWLAKVFKCGVFVSYEKS